MRKSIAKQFCLRGHDTHVVGRGTNYNCNQCSQEYHKQRYREVGMKKNYGVSAEEYNRLFAIQNGKCRICASPPGKRALSVDHDHASLRVRGLLCTRCNLMLGFASDNVTVLKAGIDYLNS